MIQLKPDHIQAFIYSAKAAISAVVVVILFDWFQMPGAAWAAISAVIVTQPSLHPSVRASVTRVIANLIGAFVGAGFNLWLGHTLPALAGGVMLTGLICHFARLDDALRPAYAAVVILILVSDSTWTGPLERVSTVIAGCAVALGVGMVCDQTAQWIGVNRDGNKSPGHDGE